MNCLLLSRLPEDMSSPPVFSVVRVTRSLVLCACFVDRCLSFYLCLLIIVLSLLHRYIDSDYSFSIFKLFSCCPWFCALFEWKRIRADCWLILILQLEIQLSRESWDPINQLILPYL